MFGVVSCDFADVIGLSKQELEDKWLAEFGRQAALVGVKNMVKHSRHFSICTIEAAVEATGRKMPRRISEVLRPLHCVDWNAMDKEVRAKTIALCEWLITNSEND